MDPSQPAAGRRRTTMIVAAAGLACLAIAVPVSGAFGAGEAARTASDGQRRRQRAARATGSRLGGQPRGRTATARGRANCPKHKGNGQGGAGPGQLGPSAVPGDSVAP